MRYSAANLCIHYYTLDFLKNKCNPDSLPKEYHVARKKIPYANPADGTTIPKSALKENTGIKLESFIFDVCALSDNMAALMVSRDEEFSPVKNKEGKDSPATARKIFSDLSIARLRDAGAIIPESKDGYCELSALVSYDGEGLEMFRGMEMSVPFVVQSASEADKSHFGTGGGPIRVVRQRGVTYYTVIDEDLYSMMALQHLYVPRGGGCTGGTACSIL